MKYLYGPVLSRRLGYSLGISLTPAKICSFDCVYCQCGKTTQKTIAQDEYVEIKDVLAELQAYLKSPACEQKPLDDICVCGFGEPTLHRGLSLLIADIKRITSVQLSLISNSSLFSWPDVRTAVLGADIIIPSLDAVTEDVFIALDRPADGVYIQDIIGGLVSLRQEYKGKMYLEVMLIKDRNDSLDYARKFKEVIEMIQPDKVQLNYPVRSVVEPWALPPTPERLLEIKRIIGDIAEIL